MKQPRRPIGGRTNGHKNKARKSARRLLAPVAVINNAIAADRALQAQRRAGGIFASHDRRSSYARPHSAGIPFPERRSGTERRKAAQQ